MLNPSSDPTQSTSRMSFSSLLHDSSASPPADALVLAGGAPLPLAPESDLMDSFRLLGQPSHSFSHLLSTDSPADTPSFAPEDSPDASVVPDSDVDASVVVPDSDVEDELPLAREEVKREWADGDETVRDSAEPEKEGSPDLVSMDVDDEVDIMSHDSAREVDEESKTLKVCLVSPTVDGRTPPHSNGRALTPRRTAQPAHQAAEARPVQEVVEIPPVDTLARTLAHRIDVALTAVALALPSADAALPIQLPAPTATADREGDCAPRVAQSAVQRVRAPGRERVGRRGRGDARGRPAQEGGQTGPREGARGRRRRGEGRSAVLRLSAAVRPRCESLLWDWGGGTED